MKVASFFLAMSITACVLGQTASTQPAVESTDPLLGKLFRSRFDGIALNPPAGGAMIRELNTGEIVRFVYADQSWDIRVKPIPLHVPMPLSAKGDGGLLEMTAVQLTNNNPTAKILQQHIVQMHGKDVGVIEARYTAGINRVYAQQAIFRDTDQHYFAVQMTSKGKPKTSAATQPDVDQDQPDAEEDQARNVFQHMLQSVKILDRRDLAYEQRRRVDKTHGLYLLINQKTILAALQPLHLMRVLRDGKDVGYVQVNERQARHNGNDGIEIILHSRMMINSQPVRPEGPSPAAPLAVEANGIVIPKSTSTDPVAASKTQQPQNVYNSSVFFVTFDRDHEDWTTVSQTDEQVSNQLTESAYSDRTVRRMLDSSKVKEGLKHPATRGYQPPVLEVPNYLLDVEYTRGRKKEAPVNTPLPPFYLPQALGQMLPRLLPNDPAQYLFAFYVGGQRNVMGRYVDVLETREVELDGQTYRAVPISDRIGVDGIPTTHYVTRQGQWLGSVSEDSKSIVLPTDLATLEKTWPGFVLSPEPPAEYDTGGDSLENPRSGGR